MPLLEVVRDDGDGRRGDDGVGDALHGAEGDDLAARPRQPAGHGEDRVDEGPQEVHLLGPDDVGDGAGQQEARPRRQVVRGGGPDEQGLLQAEGGAHGGQRDDDDAVAEAAADELAADLGDDDGGAGLGEVRRR